MIYNTDDIARRLSRADASILHDEVVKTFTSNAILPPLTLDRFANSPVLDLVLLNHSWTIEEYITELNTAIPADYNNYWFLRLVEELEKRLRKDALRDTLRATYNK